MEKTEKKASCPVCSRQFCKFFNLKRHVKKFHPDRANEITRNVLKSVACNECSKMFSKNSNLKRHVVAFHNDKIKQLISPKVQGTHKCKKISSSKGQVGKPRKLLKCSLCHSEHESKSVLYAHFEQRHDIKISKKLLYFVKEKDFNDWKSNLEKTTHSVYINEHGSYKSVKGVKKTLYICHRSGFFVTKGNKRHLKTQGTKKISGICPSELNVKVLENGKHEVSFIENHIGHDDDLGHLSLTNAERMEVGSLIASQMPFSFILDNIRDSVTDNKLERIHLLTRKDLHNITQSFNLNNQAVRHKNDVLSIESWIEEVQESGTVVYYKPQGKTCTRHPSLTEDDFVLIIVHPGQLEMLEKYSQDCVCIDGTHGLNAYNFELTTLMVLDDMREGFPCSFMFSSRSDVHVMKIFFMEIREKLGKQIVPQIFMSDMATYYYNAWLQIMSPAKFRLFCTWHTDRAWRKNLCKLASQELKMNVYKQLRTLLQEKDVQAFSIMLRNFVTSMLQSPETLEFGRYFKENYTNNVESWAYCYRLGAGINTNMHIERMHHTVKHIYLNGKKVQRLDKTINILMKFIKDKLFDRIITINKGKISTKIKDLRKRHKNCEKLNINSIIPYEMGWQVPSSTSKEIYLVEEKNLQCDCKLICSDCKACLHFYSCTCLDNSIKWNMCKHIHLVCQYRKSIRDTHVKLTTTIDDNENGDLLIDDSKNKIIEEKNRLVEILSQTDLVSNKSQEQLAEKKAQLKIYMLQLLDQISSFEELEVFKNITAPLEPTLTAIKKKIIFTPCKSNNIVPHNKSIEKQRRLCSTKKKIKSSQKINIPSSEEADTIAFQMLNNFTQL